MQSFFSTSIRDAEYPQISTRLQGHTASDLKDRKAKWHRKCYGSTCHCGYLERLEYATRRPANKERISTFNRGVDVPLHLRVYLTLLLRVTLLASRVHQQLLSMQGCVFFCQEDRKDAVHEVCTFRWGKNCKRLLKQATIKHGKFS